MSNTNQQLIDDLLIFYKELLIPFLKIRRDIYFPTEPWRQETDGEHSYLLAMVAVSVNERLGLNLDLEKVMRYSLIHDLVEVHAGDVSVRDSSGRYEDKGAKEQEALLTIKDRFANIFPWVHQAIHDYESQSDEESKFVYATDKNMGALG